MNVAAYPVKPNPLIGAFQGPCSRLAVDAVPCKPPGCHMCLLFCMLDQYLPLYHLFYEKIAIAGYDIVLEF